MRNSFVLITGATSEVGKCISSTLASLGFDLILHYHTAKNEAEQLKGYIQTQYEVKCSIVCADLSSNPSDLVRQISKIGQPKIIVNNASIFPKDTLEDAKEGSLNLNMALNLNAPLVLTQMILSAIKSQNNTNQPASIVINILDSNVFSNKMKKHFSYLIAKKGLLNLTQTIASNIDSKLLRCNAIAIGRLTSSTPKDSNHQGQNHQGQNQEGQNQQEQGHSSQGLKEYCTVDDIVSTIRFIVQTEALNGNIISLDNGSFLG